jgi:hypothetical protein
MRQIGLDVIPLAGQIIVTQKHLGLVIHEWFFLSRGVNVTL